MRKYVLTPEVRQATIWTIRDYYRLKLSYEEIVEASPAPPDGQPGSTKISDVAGSKAIRAAEIGRKIRAIEESWEGAPGVKGSRIPEEYRRGIWEHIQHRDPFPRDAGLDTYKRWHQRYIFSVATRLRWW